MPAAQDGQNSTVLSKILRETILNKLLTIESNENHKKAPLMTKNLQAKLDKPRRANMIVNIKPYKIKYEGGLPQYRIQANNLQFYETALDDQTITTSGQKTSHRSNKSVEDWTKLVMKENAR